MTNHVFSPSVGLSPVELVVLQGTSFCNLNCTYCDLSPDSRSTKSSMDSALLERFFGELFVSGRFAPELKVLWHSGEPLTLPPSYYDEAIDIILRLRDALAPGTVSLRFGIQTNGVLIDDNWCAFFKRHASRLDIGVSCDGPSDLHDLFRVNWNGKSTHLQVLRGMDLLQSNGIKYKIIAVVSRQTLQNPDRFYQFFWNRREQLSGFHFNVLADCNSPDSELAYSVEDRSAYYSFYRRMLELSRASQNGGNPFEILNFAQGTARILASKNSNGPTFFEQSSAPLRSLNVDSRGNVTTFYAGLSADVLPDEYGDGNGFSLGNILKMNLEDMVRSDKLQRIMQDFATSKHACETTCEYFSVCPGGFDILKRRSLGTFEASETAECVIHVKTLVDVLLDDIEAHLERAHDPVPQ